MRALILTAGLGTRLRPLTYVRAKAAVPVNGRPLIRRIIAWLAGEGVTDLVLNLHHLPATLTARVGDGTDLGVRVRYSWEHAVLGSAGGPRHALPLLVDTGSDTRVGDPPETTFLLVNGDTLTDVALEPLLESHRSREALVTMALVPNARPDLYGGVLVQHGYVVGFSRRGDARESFHFVGVQAADARAFSALPDGVPAESVNAVYPRLIMDSRRAIAAHVVEAAFEDVGTPADYLQTSLALAGREGDQLVGGTGIEIAHGAELERTIVWDNVTVGAGARLEECIVCDGADVPAGSRFRRCAIVPHHGRPPRQDERIEGTLLIREF